MIKSNEIEYIQVKGYAYHSDEYNIKALKGGRFLIERVYRFSDGKHYEKEYLYPSGIERIVFKTKIKPY